MTSRNSRPLPGIDRRDLMAAGLGAVTLAAGISSGQAQTQTQVQPTPTVPAPTAGAGKVTVEQRGPVLLIGMDRPQTRNLIDPAIIIGVGKALYQLEHDDGLRVAVLHGIGPDFSMGIDPPAFIAAVQAGIIPVKDPDFIGILELTPPIRTKPLVVAVQGGTHSPGTSTFLPPIFAWPRAIRCSVRPKSRAAVFQVAAPLSDSRARQVGPTRCATC
jgi:enoyl-CoA hydratase